MKFTFASLFTVAALVVTASAAPAVESNELARRVVGGENYIQPRDDLKKRIDGEAIIVERATGEELYERCKGDCLKRRVVAPVPRCKGDCL